MGDRPPFPWKSTGGSTLLHSPKKLLEIFLAKIPFIEIQGIFSRLLREDGRIDIWWWLCKDTFESPRDLHPTRDFNCSVLVFVYLSCCREKNGSPCMCNRSRHVNKHSIEKPT